MAGAGGVRAGSLCPYGDALWFPTYDRFACGAYFVNARYAGQVRRFQNELGVVFDLLGDVNEGVDEEVEFLFAFGFGGLDHHRAMHDQREADGVRVEAVIDQALGDVAGVDAFAGLPGVAENALVHGRGLVGELVVGLQQFADVGGVEHGIHGGDAESGAAVGHDVGERADQDAEVAVKSTNLAYRVGEIVGPRIRSSFVVRRSSFEAGGGEEGLEVFLHGYCAAAGAAAAVGRRKCLVQIEVHYVYAEIAGAGDADQGGAVGG